MYGRPSILDSIVFFLMILPLYHICSNSNLQEAQGPWRSAWSLARQEQVRFKCMPGMQLLGK